MEVNIRYNPLMGENTTNTTPPDASFLAQSRVPEILFGSIFPALVATIFVFGRFYSRIIILRYWGADDTWVLISWITGAIALTALNCDLTRLGAGKHIEASSLASLAPTIAIGFAARVLYQFTSMTTKLGICAFYYRVFQDRRSKIFVWAMAAYIVSYSIPLIIAIFLQCNPIEGAWKTVPAKCLKSSPQFEASSILGIFADIALLVFVIPRILSLKLPKQQKISLLIVCCLSILVIIAAIIRIVRILKVLDSADTPWDSYDISIWTSVEVNVGIFCVAAPATKPLLKKFAPGLGFSSNRSTTLSHSTKGYARDTISSRRRQPNRDGEFEMMNGNELDLEFGKLPKENVKEGNDTFWVSESERESNSLKDGDSERREIRPVQMESPADSPVHMPPEIRRTVTVFVETRPRSEELAVGQMGGGVKRFEHV